MAISQMLTDRMLFLVGGALLDLVYGDPSNLWHPVRGIGALIAFFEKLLRKLFRVPSEASATGKGETGEGGERDRGFAGRETAAGVFLVLLVTGCTVAIAAGILLLARRISRPLYAAVSVLMTWQILALKDLVTESGKVERELNRGDVEGARRAVSMIVGRDTSVLDAEGIARAAVETVAEGASDGVIAPLFFLLLLGVPGGWFYKAVNTMDSMVGYKNARYLHFGRAAARLDDFVNFLPARIAGVCICLVAYILPEANGALAWRIFKRDRKKHESPNAGQTEAAMAGALDLSLGGDTVYACAVVHKEAMGDGGRRTRPGDISRANHLAEAASALVLFVGELLLFVAAM
ncbi:MAG: adenosylcobinamide-phosphate synthase CbiB [Lachnospiraceae bacterium]|nr:adenosylcobinamide-phosphate synthase CbiB [Lachnospiraceae bacterium]